MRNQFLADAWFSLVSPKERMSSGTRCTTSSLCLELQPDKLGKCENEEGAGQYDSENRTKRLLSINTAAATQV